MSDHVAIARLTRLMLERAEREQTAGNIRQNVPRPRAIFTSADPAPERCIGNNYDDYPEMSQDDWRDQLNPNEGCK